MFFLQNLRNETSRAGDTIKGRKQLPQTVSVTLRRYETCTERCSARGLRTELGPGGAWARPDPRVRLHSTGSATSACARRTPGPTWPAGGPSRGPTASPARRRDLGRSPHPAGTPVPAGAQLSRGRNLPTPGSRSDRKTGWGELCAGATCSVTRPAAARGRWETPAPWGRGGRRAETGPRAYHVAPPAAPDCGRTSGSVTRHSQQPAKVKG